MMLDLVRVMECGSGGVKTEKAMAMQRYRRIHQIGTVLRCAEVVAFLAFVSWSSSRLPDAFRLSAVFLRRLASLLVSTPFVFLIGNAIVLTLFAKSKQYQQGTCSSPSSDGHQPHHSIYDEFMSAAADVHQCRVSPSLSITRQTEDFDGVEYEDKAVCFVEAKPAGRPSSFRRTKSENMKRSDGKRKQLRRTTTDVMAEEKKMAVAITTPYTETEKEKEKYKKYVEEEDEEEYTESMSNEELRRRAEAFIAKQIRFQRAESIAAVIAGGDGPEARD